MPEATKSSSRMSKARSSISSAVNNLVDKIKTTPATTQRRRKSTLFEFEPVAVGTEVVLDHVRVKPTAEPGELEVAVYLKSICNKVAGISVVLQPDTEDAGNVWFGNPSNPEHMKVNFRLPAGASRARKFINVGVGQTWKVTETSVVAKEALESDAEFKGGESQSLASRKSKVPTGAIAAVITPSVNASQELCPESEKGVENEDTKPTQAETGEVSVEAGSDPLQKSRSGAETQKVQNEDDSVPTPTVTVTGGGSRSREASPRKESFRGSSFADILNERREITDTEGLTYEAGGIQKKKEGVVENQVEDVQLNATANTAETKKLEEKELQMPVEETKVSTPTGDTDGTKKTRKSTVKAEGDEDKPRRKSSANEKTRRKSSVKKDAEQEADSKVKNKRKSVLNDENEISKDSLEKKDSNRRKSTQSRSSVSKRNSKSAEKSEASSDKLSAEQLESVTPRPEEQGTPKQGSDGQRRSSLQNIVTARRQSAIVQENESLGTAKRQSAIVQEDEKKPLFNANSENRRDSLLDSALSYLLGDDDSYVEEESDNDVATKNESSKKGIKQKKKSPNKSSDEKAKTGNEKKDDNSKKNQKSTETKTEDSEEKVRRKSIKKKQDGTGDTSARQESEEKVRRKSIKKKQDGVGDTSARQDTARDVSAGQENGDRHKEDSEEKGRRKSTKKSQDETGDTSGKQDGTGDTSAKQDVTGDASASPRKSIKKKQDGANTTQQKGDEKSKPKTKKRASVESELTSGEQRELDEEAENRASFVATAFQTISSLVNNDSSENQEEHEGKQEELDDKEKSGRRHSSKQSKTDGDSPNSKERRKSKSTGSKSNSTNAEEGERKEKRQSTIVKKKSKRSSVAEVDEKGKNDPAKDKPIEKRKSVLETLEVLDKNPRLDLKQIELVEEKVKAGDVSPREAKKQIASVHKVEAFLQHLDSPINNGAASSSQDVIMDLPQFGGYTPSVTDDHIQEEAGVEESV